MLKIVPDPPRSPHFLEDTIIQAAEHALCAQAVAQQAFLLQPRAQVAILMTSSLHELETVRVLLETVLAQIQMPLEAHTLH
ncbi:hypothetical protein G7011_19535 [Pseudomonas plecoglossicida]|uniref:hypothetical protein n=1 Tax=Pseudomonas plecoglossicida TaxID=70775 RepID=UPI0015E3B38F|nr:hypothetical protein [Pseudomonas plecoglossicida]MBA1199302.1 hypothetical protein [Pseudomonas plecoglossicida]